MRKSFKPPKGHKPLGEVLGGIAEYFKSQKGFKVEIAFIENVGVNNVMNLLTGEVAEDTTAEEVHLIYRQKRYAISLSDGFANIHRIRKGWINMTDIEKVDLSTPNAFEIIISRIKENAKKRSGLSSFF